VARTRIEQPSPDSKRIGAGNKKATGEDAPVAK